MKALITVIDDNGRLFCKDNLVFPTREDIINVNSNQPPIKKVLFEFMVIQLMDYQSNDFEKLGGEQNDTPVED